MMGYDSDASCPVTFIERPRFSLAETHRQKVALKFLGAVTISIVSVTSLANTYAQVEPITSSGLNTQVNLSATPPAGKVQYDITGGTRPEGGPNLFHSFSEFGVPSNNIANFLNEAGLPTSNILGRVTGGNMSNIFGTIQTSPSFGNANLFLLNPAGFLFGPNATVNVGGMVAFTSADYLRLAEIDATNAGVFHADPAQASLLTNAPIAAFGFLGSNPGAITVQGSQFSVANGQSISLIGGNIMIQAGTPENGTAQPAHLSAPNGQILLASSASPGEFEALTLQPLSNVNSSSFKSFGFLTTGLGSHIAVSGTNNVSIRGGEFVLSVNDAMLTTSQSFHTPETISLKPGSVIGTSNFGPEPGANIQLIASNIQLDNSIVSTITAGNGNAGNILMAGNRFQSESTQITSSTTPLPGFLGGDGGTIQLDIALDAHLSNSSIDAQTVANGKAGNVFVEATKLTLNSSTLSTGTAPQNGATGGNAGDIQVTVGQLIMNDGQIVSQSSFSKGNGGKVTVTATDSITTAGSGNLPFAISTLTEGAAPFCPGNCGNAGSITLMAPTVELNGVGLNSSTTGQGNAGNILAKVGTLTVMNGAEISASAENPGIVTGTGGTITIQGIESPADSVLIDGPGSGIFTDTQGTGEGGDVVVKANSITLTNAATLSASSTGQIENPGEAGDIDIIATNGFTMQNSAVTTQAGQGASGGDIKVTTAPSATVLLENSRISASVADGSGGGGNISIDPQYVILQNSQILAQAADGQGGAITITTNLFLPDAFSLQNVKADSGSGVNGTVTIQSPNSPASGKIQPLGNELLETTSLLNQRCAAMTGGEFSSFTVAGRDSLPTEPGSWLASPLATLSASTGRVGKAEASERALLSLRQVAPTGFLTQAFAQDWSAGCQS